ncbi:MAG: hypothetical protein QOD71_3151 [Thermoleophilaceae bacterium]|jgi:hypothetical protein|nr:hypothetical protein [Thermoleophilaceae bacterium]
MQNFLIGVFNDLRARRLLPVAVLLVAGLVAAPVMLSKKAGDSAAPAPEQPAAKSKSAKPQGPAELAQVKLDEIAKGSGSSLSAFDTSDPFAPPRKVVAAASRQAGADAGTAAPDTGGTTTDTGTPTGGGTTEGSTPDTGTGGGGTKTSEFTYVLDVTFWANGRTRKIEGMEKLDMLPSQAAPLLIFMGVSDGAGNAVFLVDSTLDTAGEGKCKPSPSDCAFLYLGAGSEQEFTNDDGDSYRLRIDEIRKVKVGDGSGTAGSSKASSKSARAAVGATAPARRFAFPVLTDLVVQSGVGSDNSTDASERR